MLRLGALHTSFGTLICVMLGVAAIGATSSLADEPNSLVQLLSSKRATECQDFVYNAKELIPRLYNENKLDSVDQILVFVGQRCGECSLNPLPLLLRIQREGLPEDWCDTVLAENILGRSRHSYGLRFVLDELRFASAQCPVPGASSFDDFIISLADSISQRADANSNEYLIAEYYRGNREEIISRLSRGGYQGTCVQERYRNRISQLLSQERARRTNWSVNAGPWIPGGKSSLLGPKVELGVQGGLRFGRKGIDLTALFRFLDSKEPYLVRHREKIVQTDYFFGLYLGIDPSMCVISFGKYNMEVFGGIGYDGFTAIASKNADETESINAFCLNFGITQRLFLSRSSIKYIGIQTRYNMVDYVTHGGSDLSRS